ncbi:hypothetical protein FGB62_305g05 [Gracilaria domingensis]|nr:hypothetical protein FGB62_305g05 [Gracilaria domingensis]
MLGERALDMYINKSVVDNEFFECDVPFKVNAFSLPTEWHTLRHRSLRPKYFADSSVRYMVTFLAQYGKEWLEDSVKIRVVRDGEVRNCSRKSNFLHRARLATSLNLRDNEAGKKEKNRSITWSRIISWREREKTYSVDNGIHMPFGMGKGDDVLPNSHRDPEWFSVSFRRFESKIKRLIDDLPQHLSELSLDEDRNVDYFKKICSSDLENFLLFLQSEPVAPLRTVKSREPVAPVRSTGGIKQDLKRRSIASILLMLLRMAYLRLKNCDWFDNMLRTPVSRDPQANDAEEIEEEEVLSHLNLDPELVLSEKAGGSKLDDLGFSALSGGSLNGSLNRWIEFTVHLENFSSILSSVAFFHKYRIWRLKHPYLAVDWKTYLEGLRFDPSSYSFLKTKDFKPQCRSQMFYWKGLWLPENAPDAIGQRGPNISETKDGQGIRFIGYITEIVRNCLAEWTATAGMADMNDSCWTVRLLPTERAVKFRTESNCNLAMLWTDFKERGSSDPFLSIPRKDGESHPLDTYMELIIWECQRYLLRMIGGGKCKEGPRDLNLILLFLLGFPVLNTTKSGCVVTVEPVVPGLSLKLLLSVVASDENGVSIEMNLVRKKEGETFPKSTEERNQSSGSSDEDSSCSEVEFCWEDWIHLFDGCMKVLSLDFRDGDFDEESCAGEGGDSRIGNSRRGDEGRSEKAGEGKDSGEHHNGVDGSDDDGSHHDEDNATSTRSWESKNSVTKNTVDLGEWIGVQTCKTCTCEYRLNQQAEKMEVRNDIDNKTKCYWDWKGWTPQWFFRKHPLPLRYKKECIEGNTGTSMAPEEDCGLQVAAPPPPPTQLNYTNNDIAEITDRFETTLEVEGSAESSGNASRSGASEEQIISVDVTHREGNDTVINFDSNGAAT